MGSRSWRTLLALVCIGVLCAGCDDRGGRASEQPRDEVEVVPFDSTRMLREEDLRSLEVDPESGLLTFAETPPGLRGIKRGEVIVAGVSEATPQGLLRIVKTVRADGERLELDTLHAPLQLAFKRVHIKSAPRSTGPLGASAWPGSGEPLLFDVGARQKVRVVVFDGDGNVATKNDQVLVDGELGGFMEFTFELDFDWGALDELPELVTDCVSGLLEARFDCSLTSLLPEAKAVFAVTPSLASHLELSGAAILSFEKEFVLFQQNLGVLVFGPIIVTPNVQIIAHVAGSASALFRASVDAAVAFETSVTLSSRHPNTPAFMPPALKDVELEAMPPEVTLTARGEAGLGASLSLLIYGVAGPYLAARAFGAVDADVFREPCVQLSAGLAGKLGVKVTTPAILFLDPIEILDWHADLGPIEQNLDVPLPHCEPPPMASTLPPGSGPDAEHLAMPTFEPWSRTWDGLMDSVVAPGGTTFWLDQGRSIDGHVVVAGRGSEALTKLSETGELVWSRKLYADPENRESLLRPVRIASTRDAGLAVLSEGRVPPSSFIKVTQAGNALFRRELALPDELACGGKPVGLTGDGGHGLYVVLACSLAPRFYVLHLGAKGELLDAVSLHDPEATTLEPTTVMNVGPELFVAGRVARAGDSMFALRRDAQGALAFVRRYEACEEAPDVYPVRALVEENGDVTVAGRGGAERNGFLARITRDGAVGFSAFAGFGFGLSSVYVLDGIAQLPTTGYLVSASTVRLTGSDLAAVPAIALSQLDAVGKPVWTQRYTLFSGQGAYAAASHTDLHLSDDGGALLSGMVQRDPEGLTASLWALKVPARDGHIAFASDRATAVALDGADEGIVALPCSLTDVPYELLLRSEPEVTTRLAPVEAVAFAPAGDAQTR